MMIRFGTLDFGEEERNAIFDLINQKDPQLTLGKNVYNFERAFANWIGADYAVMVNSGTSALITALYAVRRLIVLPFITTSLTYPAVWNALTLSGYPFTPLDVPKEKFVIEYSKDIMGMYESFLTVDLLGKPCHITPIIEDATEALGSSINSKLCGSNSIAGVFSFQVAHQINTIEGGMVVSNHKDINEYARSFRDNGRICTCPICELKTHGICPKRKELEGERRWMAPHLGANFKPTEINGVLGLVKMKKLDKNISRRHIIYKRYFEEFPTLEEEEKDYIVPLAYPVKMKSPIIAVKKLEDKGIECRGMFPSYSKTFKNATEVSNSYILIPSHQDISDKDVEYIIDKIKEVQKNE